MKPLNAIAGLFNRDVAIYPRLPQNPSSKSAKKLAKIDSDKPNKTEKKKAKDPNLVLNLGIMHVRRKSATNSVSAQTYDSSKEVISIHDAPHTSTPA